MLYVLLAYDRKAVKEFVAHINDMFQTNGNATVETGADIANAEAEAAADADAAADANVDASVGADARCDTASIATDAGVLRHGGVSAETAIKFLFARKFDVRRAVALFEQHELIRQREHLDQLNAEEEPLHSELSTGKFTILVCYEGCIQCVRFTRNDAHFKCFNSRSRVATAAAPP